MLLAVSAQRRFTLTGFLSLSALAVVSACFVAPIRAQGQKSGSGRLDSVAVRGSTKFKSGQIAPATGLRSGDQITRDDIQKGADMLAALGLFSNVQYRFTTTATSGVSVEYDVADAPTVPVFFDNFPWFTDDELIDAIKTSVHLFDGTVPDHGAILDDVSSALSRQLVARGVAPDVSHDLVTLPGRDGQVLRFRAEGTQVIVQTVEFSDELADHDHHIHDRLEDLVGKPFSRSAVELFEFDQVRPVYFAHGLLRVRFGEPSAHLEGTGKAIVRAPIDPGPAFTWGGVMWSGNTAIPSSELDKLVELSPGINADGMKIQSTWESVRHAFARRGYLDVDLNPVPHFDDAAKRVSYEAKITEGPQYHMGNLVLTGLSMEGERRIRSGWKIATGAVFDSAVYEDFLNSGIKQSLAGLPVHYEKVGRFLQKDAAGAKLDVLLDFQ
jgi:outer membrane protein assembly factor BamA